MTDKEKLMLRCIDATLDEFIEESEFEWEELTWSESFTITDLRNFIDKIKMRME